MTERIRINKETMRLSSGIGLVAKFLGVRLELNYCFPTWFQAQDRVCYSPNQSVHCCVICESRCRQVPTLTRHRRELIS